ncbi:MAG: hypothetical protein HY961_00200 [Ignavibacteriae bacterium]|nr:hypothetical protein [Ignavibacteriota bacterium]
MNIHRIRFALPGLALLACLPCASLSQHFSFPIEHIDTENGLSHNTVSCITQDSRGFIWIGTIDGLNRFDGYTCRVFKHDPLNPHSLSSSFIHNISEDRNGTLWVTTRDGGVNRFDYRAETFSSFQNNPADTTTIGGNKAGAVFQDSRGILWVTTDAGLHRFDHAAGTFTRFSHNPDDASSLSNDQVTGIAEDPDGTLWIATDDGLNKFDPRRGKVVLTFRSRSDDRSLSDNRLVGVLLARNGMLWVGTRGNGVNMLDRTSGTFKRFTPDANNPRKPSSEYVAPMVEDERGNIWCATHDGVNVYELATGIFHRLPHVPNSTTSISHSIISSILLDTVGDVWIGTWGGGVNKLGRRLQKFSAISSRTAPGVLLNDFVLAMMVDHEGALWVGTGDGLSRNVARSGQSAAPSQHLLRKMSVWCLMQNADSTIWAGTGDRGIATFTANGLPLRQFVLGDSLAIADNTIRALFRDRRGVIWAGTQAHGVNSYDAATRRWTHYPFGKTDGTSVSDELVWAINEDHDGHLWFGTYLGGLNEYDPTSKTFSYYQHRANDSTSLGANDVRTICVTRAGELWIGTYGGGICLLNKATGRFTRVTERDGLANNFVYGILEDDDANLWISTNKGVSRYNPAARIFRNYTARDGLQSDEFNTGAYFRDSTGELFFGGVGGLNRFFPHEVYENKHVPPIVLTSFKIVDRELTGKSLSLLDSVQLDYSDGFFSFEFAALDYVDPLRNQYAYMLEGFDHDWIYSGARRYVSYTNLDPGKYTLRMKGSNSDGVWNEQGKSVLVTIVPPFWMTAWFKLIVGVLIVGTFAGTVRFISTRKLKEQLRTLEKQRALQEERERISRDLHDNVGAQLSTIITGLELAEKYEQKTDHARSENLLVNLKDDARLTMAQLRETIWALSSSSMSLVEFFESIEAYGKKQVQHRISPKIWFLCEGKADVTLSSIQVLHLFRIAQEALTNALKHADAQNIHIGFECKERRLLLRVKDDGVIRQDRKADEFSGRGLANMERRAHELNGRFTFSQSEGTTVEIEIPLDGEYPK